MKTFRLFTLSIICSLISFVGFAQNKTATFDVSGNCSMCKKTIEKAAKSAGASYANWDMDAKKLTVHFNNKTSVEKIQQKIALAGYDNAGATASDAAYDKLHACCKYERKAAKADADCCEKGEACCKDGKADCCKDKKSAAKN
ncbi:heavy-metal-associated domain-containing protein [Niabella digestorum]|jgi:Heavy-metal-associated domain.|uniref:Cation transporter n=1 Tax=Niabella digestorum TaxID=3117701 RepID=A0ABU7RCP4_9BACT